MRLWCVPYWAKEFFLRKEKEIWFEFTATVDNKCQIINVNISHPGATSDYLAFFTSSLKWKLEDGLLATGKYILGDSTYVNTPYVEMPYKSPSQEQDNYNFYHSQLRITVKRVFYILIQRWSILRRLLSAAMGLHKITALTMNENCCIDEQELEIPQSLCQDKAYGMCKGGGSEYQFETTRQFPRGTCSQSCSTRRWTLRRFF